MPYTSHGWWFGHNGPTRPVPRLFFECGGPHVCQTCALEALHAENEATMTDPTPPPRAARIGDHVLYVESYNTPDQHISAERAAVVTEVNPLDPDNVGLCVFNPFGLIHKPLAHGGVARHDGDTGHDHTGTEIPGKSYTGGTWHWPVTK